MRENLKKVELFPKWKQFKNRAMLSCKNSGYGVDDQFAEVGKLITHAKCRKRKTYVR